MSGRAFYYWTAWSTTRGATAGDITGQVLTVDAGLSVTLWRTDGVGQPLGRSRGNVASLFQHGFAGLLRIRQLYETVLT